jgi:hypothetical protein
MTTNFVLEPASRQGIILLIGLWGGTGGGKTESALRLARGIAGPKGRVGIVDTEHRRASYYVDRIPGGFSSIDFAAPYTPERYMDALDVLQNNADVGVLDSASHAWEGPDGILDLHEQALDKMTKGSDNWSERERLNWPAWREPKMRLKALRNLLLGFKIPLIICFRGEEKTRMQKDDRGRNTVITDTNTSPIFEKKFIFEMHVAVEVFQQDGRGGFIRFPYPHAKVSHEDIRKILPEAGKEQLSVECGAKLAAWSSGKASSSPATTTHDKGKLLAELRDVTRSIHNWKRSDGAEAWPAAKELMTRWIIDELGIETTLDAQSVEELAETLSAAKRKLTSQPANLL